MRSFQRSVWRVRVDLGGYSMLRGEVWTGEVRSGFGCNQDEGPREGDVVKGSRMAVIDPSKPDAGTKKRGKVRETQGHALLLAGGLSLLHAVRSGRSSTASRCRSRSAGFLVPTGALTLVIAHDATEMQADPRRCRGPVRMREWTALEISRESDVIPGEASVSE